MFDVEQIVNYQEGRVRRLVCVFEHSESRYFATQQTSGQKQRRGYSILASLLMELKDWSLDNRWGLGEHEHAMKKRGLSLAVSEHRGSLPGH